MGSLTSNSIRNLALQLATPSQRINGKLEQVAGRIHRVLKLDIDDPAKTWFGEKFRIPRAGCHADFQGAPLHTLLFGFTLLVVGARSLFLLHWNRLASYSLACFASALLFALVLRWQPWHTRLHLPILMLLSPAAATLLSRWPSRWPRSAVVLILTLAAAPCVLKAHARPLIGPDSVLTTPRIEQYFANRRQVIGPYKAAASSILRTGSNQTGLIMGRDDWEYPLWVLTAGHTSFVHIYVDNESREFADLDTSRVVDTIVCTDKARCSDLFPPGEWQVLLDDEKVVVLSRN